MDDLEQKLRRLEEEVTEKSERLPLVQSVKQLAGWQKVVVVVIIGLVLFTIVQLIFNLLVSLVTMAIFGVIVYWLYKLFFQTDRVSRN